MAAWCGGTVRPATRMYGPPSSPPGMISTCPKKKFWRLLLGFLERALSLELLAEASGLKEPECSKYLGQLVENSIARREGDRFSLHQLVRDFVREGLDSESRKEVIQSQIVSAACVYADRYSVETATGYDKLEGELDNLKGAIDYAEQSSAWANLIDIARPLLESRILDIRGYWDMAVKIGRAGMAAAERNSSWSVFAIFADSVAKVMQAQGDHNEADHLLQRSQEIQENTGATLVPEVRGIFRQAESALKKGDCATARDLCAKAVDLSRELKKQSEVASGLNLLGEIACNEGDYQRAKELLQESLDMSQSLGHLSSVAISLQQLSMVALAQKDYLSATQFCKKSLEARKQMKEPAGISRSLHQLGLIAEAQGDYLNARTFYEDSLRISRGLRYLPGEADTLYQLGVLAMAQNNPTEGRSFIEQSARILDNLDQTRAKSVRDDLEEYRQLHSGGVSGRHRYVSL